MTPDDQPLSDNAADDRFKAALATIGTAPGASTQADTELVLNIAATARSESPNTGMKAAWQ
jgi:hypothetical protein